MIHRLALVMVCAYIYAYVTLLLLHVFFFVTFLSFFSASLKHEMHRDAHFTHCYSETEESAVLVVVSEVAWEDQGGGVVRTGSAVLHVGGSERLPCTELDKKRGAH